jgi:hypothetical protein
VHVEAAIAGFPGAASCITLQRIAGGLVELAILDTEEVRAGHHEQGHKRRHPVPRLQPIR